MKSDLPMKTTLMLDDDVLAALEQLQRIENKKWSTTHCGAACVTWKCNRDRASHFELRQWIAARH
jgi:hypothetical protein